MGRAGTGHRMGAGRGAGTDPCRLFFADAMLLRRLFSPLAGTGGEVDMAGGRIVGEVWAPNAGAGFSRNPASATWKARCV